MQCSMVVLISRTDLGIILQPRNSVCNCVVDPFYIDNFWSKISKSNHQLYMMSEVEPNASGVRFFVISVDVYWLPPPPQYSL
jgi:hypothetical protein